MRGRSSVWLERRPVKPEVASSSLVGPAIVSVSNRMKRKYNFRKKILTKSGRFQYEKAILNGRIAQLEEHRPYKPVVTGSSPVSPMLRKMGS